MNLAGEALTGWFKEDALGKSLASVCTLVEGKNRVVLDGLIQRAVSESRTVALPVGTRLISRDGREATIEGCLSPIHDSQGELLGIALTFRSICARMELERARRQNEVQKRQAQKMEVVRGLAGGAANHLNNLLTVIQGSISQVLAETPEQPKAQETLRGAQNAALRAAELVERLLHFSERPHDPLRLVALGWTVAGERG
jgi:PAS domain S-box-containing protein